jgi:mono/diheme cytochrome c family protein
MRIASTLQAVFWMVGGSAWGQESNMGDDVRLGHRLAATVCATCHLPAPDQPEMPFLKPPAPSFESIAQREDITADSLEHFISTTHRGLDNPNGMPSRDLPEYRVKQVVAYTLSLRT